MRGLTGEVEREARSGSALGLRALEQQATAAVLVAHSLRHGDRIGVGMRAVRMLMRRVPMRRVPMRRVFVLVLVLVLVRMPAMPVHERRLLRADRVRFEHEVRKFDQRRGEPEQQRRQRAAGALAA